MSRAPLEERPAVGPARGVLPGPGPGTPFDHRRVRAAPALRDLVAHLWWVAWEGAEPFEAQTLPHPCVALVFGWPQRTAEVVGVCTTRFRRAFAGPERHFGIKLRPGAFRSFVTEPVSTLTDRRIPIEAALGGLGRALREAVLATQTLEEAIAAAESLLLAERPHLSAGIAEIRDLAERIEHDRTITRVEPLAKALGVATRTLERRFRDAVGVSPTWVVRRYRLIEAVERLKAGDAATLAALAAELGYCDQSHFSRDFKALVGQAPQRFLARA